MEKKIKSFTYISKDGTILRDHIGRIEKVKSAASKIIDEVKNKTSRKDISKKNETNAEDIDDSSTEEISKTIYKNFEEGPISSNRKRTFCSEKSGVDHLGCYTQAITDITLQEDAGLNLAQSDTKDKSVKTDIRGKSFREDNLKYNVGTHGFVLGNSGFGTNLLGLRTETKAEAETRLHGDASMELTNSYIDESTAITDKKGNTSHKNQSQKTAGARGHIVGIAGIKTNVLGCKIEPEAETRLYGDAKMIVAHSSINTSTSKTDNKGNTFDKDRTNNTSRAQGRAVGKAELKANVLGCKIEAEAETRLLGDAKMDVTHTYINKSTSKNDKKGNTLNKDQVKSTSRAQGHAIGNAEIKANVLGYKIEAEAETRFHGDAKMDVTDTYINKSTSKNDNKGNTLKKDQVKNASRAQGQAVGKAEIKANVLGCKIEAEAETTLHGDAKMNVTHTYIDKSTSKNDNKGNTLNKDQVKSTSRAHGHAVGKAEIKANVLGCKIEAEAETRLHGDTKIDVTHTYINKSTSKTDNKGNTFDKDREKNTSRAQGLAVGKAELKANVLGFKIEAEAETSLHGDAKIDVTHTYINKSTSKNDNKGKTFNKDQVQSTSRAQGRAVGKAELKANVLGCKIEAEAETRLHGDAKIDVTHTYINKSTSKTDNKGNTFDKDREKNTSRAQGRAVGKAELKANVFGCKIEAEAETRLHGDAKIDVTHTYINKSTSKTDNKGNTFDKDREKNTSRAHGRAVGKAELKANVLGCKIEAEAETRLHGDAKIDVTHAYINKSTSKNDNNGNTFDKDREKNTSRAQGRAVGKAELKANVLGCKIEAEAETRLLGDAKMDVTHTYINKSTLKNDNKGNIFNRDQVKSTSRAQGHAVGKAEIKANVLGCKIDAEAETRLHGDAKMEYTNSYIKDTKDNISDNGNTFHNEKSKYAAGVKGYVEGETGITANVFGHKLEVEAKSSLHGEVKGEFSKSLRKEKRKQDDGNGSCSYDDRTQYKFKSQGHVRGKADVEVNVFGHKLNADVETTVQGNAKGELTYSSRRETISKDDDNDNMVHEERNQHKAKIQFDASGKAGCNANICGKSIGAEANAKFHARASGNVSSNHHRESKKVDDLNGNTCQTNLTKYHAKAEGNTGAHVQGQVKMLDHNLKGKAEVSAHGMVQGTVKHNDMHQELSVENTKVAKHTYHEFTVEGKAEGKAKCNVAANSGKRVFKMVAEIEGETKGKVQFCVGKANYEKTPNSFKGNFKAIQLKASGEANIEGSVNINGKSKTLQGKAEGKVDCSVLKGKADFKIKKENGGLSVSGLTFSAGNHHAKGKAHFDVNGKRIAEISGESKMTALSAQGCRLNVQKDEDTDAADFSNKAGLASVNAINADVVGKRTGKLSTLTKDSTAAELKLGNVSVTGLDERKSSKVVSSTFKTGARANILNADVKGLGPEGIHCNVDSGPSFNMFNLKAGINRQTGSTISSGGVSFFNANLSLGCPNLSLNSGIGAFNFGIPFMSGGGGVGGGSRGGDVKDGDGDGCEGHGDGDGCGIGGGGGDGDGSGDGGGGGGGSSRGGARGGSVKDVDGDSCEGNGDDDGSGGDGSGDGVGRGGGCGGCGGDGSDGDVGGRGGGGGGGGVGGGVCYDGDEAVRGDNAGGESGGDGVCSGSVYVDGGGKDGGSYIDGDNCWEGGDGYDSGAGEGNGGYISSGRFTGGGDNCAEVWEGLVDGEDGNIGVDGCETEEIGDMNRGAEWGSYDNYDGNRGDGSGSGEYVDGSNRNFGTNVRDGDYLGESGDDYFNGANKSGRCHIGGDGDNWDEGIDGFSDGPSGLGGGYIDVDGFETDESRYTEDGGSAVWGSYDKCDSNGDGDCSNRSFGCQRGGLSYGIDDDYRIGYDATGKINVSDSSRYRDDNDTIYGSLESGSFGFLNSNGDSNVENLVSDSFGSSSCGGIDEGGISVCSYGDRGFRTGIEMNNADIGNVLRRNCNDQNARFTCLNNDVDIEEDRNGERNCIGVDSLCCGVSNNDFVQNVETGINTDFTKDTLPFDLEDSASYNMYMAGLVEQSLNKFKTSKPGGSKPSSINPVNHENVMKFWSDPDKVESYLFEKYLPFKSDLDSTSCSNEPRTSRNRKTVKKTRPAPKPFGEKKNIHTIFTVNGSDSKDIKYIGKNVACFADKD